MENNMKNFRFSILIMLLLAIAGCATGSHIITGKVKPALDPNKVKLYLEPPSEYEVIGIVEASSDVELFTQAAQDRAIQELKKQAAQIGANGVLIQSTGHQTNTSGYYSGGAYYPIDTETKTATGKAIFVK